MASGVKEGSIMEGILAIYIAMILADPNDGDNINELKGNIDKFRKQTVLKEGLNPRIGIKKEFPKDDDLGYDIAVGDPKVNPNMKQGQPYIIQQREGKPADFIQVALEVYLKPAEVYPGFGDEYDKYAEQKKDYGKLAKKIDTMIASKKSILFRKIIQAKKRFLMNKNTDVVRYEVLADGVTGEQADGNIKADIMVKIIANGRELVRDQINLSVKSDSTTVQNAGIIKGLQSMYDVIGPPKSKSSMAKKLMEDIAKAKGETKLQYVSAMFDLLGENLKGSSGPDFTNRAFNFLEEAIFGDDMAQVIDLTSSGGKVKEIEPGQFKAYRKYGNAGKPILLKAHPESGDIRIMPMNETNKNNFLFKFRFKKRNYKDGSGQYVEKIMIETGKLAYSKK
jgi:hypothetical protein